MKAKACNAEHQQQEPGIILTARPCCGAGLIRTPASTTCSRTTRAFRMASFSACTCSPRARLEVRCICGMPIPMCSLSHCLSCMLPLDYMLPSFMVLCSLETSCALLPNVAPSCDADALASLAAGGIRIFLLKLFLEGIQVSCTSLYSHHCVTLQMV
jgi:hypothetical protein